MKSGRLLVAVALLLLGSAAPAADCRGDADCQSGQRCEGASVFSNCPDCEARCDDAGQRKALCRQWCNRSYDGMARDLCQAGCGTLDAVDGFSCRLFCEQSEPDCETLVSYGTCCGPRQLSGTLFDLPEFIRWGETFAVRAQVRNDSDCSVAGAFVQSFHLSRDTLWFVNDRWSHWFDPEDIRLDVVGGDGGLYRHTGEIRPNSPGAEFSVTLKLPDAPPPGFSGVGPFYLGMRTDFACAVDETVECIDNRFLERLYRSRPYWAPDDNGPGSLARGKDWDSFRVPSVSIGDGWAVEGNDASDAGKVAFTLRLTRALPEPVTILYATIGGSAEAGRDFEAVRNGVAVIGQRQTQATIEIRLIGDRWPEPDETFEVILLSADRAPIGHPRGAGTIVNDDGDRVPVVRCGVGRIAEGNSGTRLMEIPVQVEPAALQPVTIRYRTRDGSATAASDYVPAARIGQSITILDARTAQGLQHPGQPGASGGGAQWPPPVGRPGDERFVNSGVIRIPVIGDLEVEPDETFYVEFLNVTNARLLTPRCEGVIENDDLPVVSISAETIVEENFCLGTDGIARPTTPTVEANCQVRLSAIGDQNVRVYWRTVPYPPGPNSAVAGADYVDNPGGVAAFSPSGLYLNQAVTVLVINDGDIAEPEEVFGIVLDQAVGARIDPQNRQCQVRIRQPALRSCPG